MQDLSDIVFTNMTSVTLLRHDSYLDLLKPRAMAALRNSPLHIASLFPQNVIAKAEEDIFHHDDKYYSGSLLRSLKNTTHILSLQSIHKILTKKTGLPAWKQLSFHGQFRRGHVNSYSQQQAKGQNTYKPHL